MDSDLKCVEEARPVQESESTIQRLVYSYSEVSPIMRMVL